MYTVRQPRRSVPRVAAVLSLGCATLVAGTASSAPAEPPFVNGSADAVANLGRVVARASGLPLATTYGGARAHYQGTSARAEAAAVDFGVLGFMLTTPMGCGRALLTPDQLPKRTTADSSGGQGSASKDVAGSGPVGAGREAASARSGALGESSFTSAALEIGELLSSGEGKTSSAAELVAGHERRATASVRIGNLDVAGGLVSLRGLRWATEQRTGAGGRVLRAEGAFGVDTILVAGLPLPTATPLELAAAFGAANKVIAPLGLRLEAPQMTKSTADREVRVTPLKLVLGDGTAAKPLLGPLMEGAQPAREALLEAMQGFGQGDCNLGSAGGFSFTFVDVAAAAMQGSGGIDLEIGGVLATTEGVDYGDPFGLTAPGLPAIPATPAPAVRPARPPLADVTADEGLASGTAPFETAGSAPGSITGAAPVEVVVPAGPSTDAAEPVATLPVTRRCESTSRGRVSGCSRGAPLPASAAVLAGALLLFGGDWWRTRRRAASEVTS